MTERTLLRSPARAGTTWEARLVLGSITLLSGLAVADRMTAWLIGEFPASALLWQLRFEFLRPIGVYYDIVERNLGTLSPFGFSALVLIAAAATAGSALSRIRLARALSCHLLLGAALVLSVMSWHPGPALRAHAQVGMPSEPYAMLGIVFALTAAALCLRIHAEYIGWNPPSSRTLRRLRIATLRLRLSLAASVADLVEQLNPGPRRARAALASTRTSRYKGSKR